MESALPWLKSWAAESPEGLPLKNIAGFVLEKFQDLLLLLGNLLSLFHSKADEFLPPETRAEVLRRWAHVGFTTVLPIALLLLFLYYGCCCCCRCFRSCCCCLPMWSPGRMMRAPGRLGKFIPRSSFEADPKSYFINLRANRELFEF